MGDEAPKHDDARRYGLSRKIRKSAEIDEERHEDKGQSEPAERHGREAPDGLLMRSVGPKCVTAIEEIRNNAARAKARQGRCDGRKACELDQGDQNGVMDRRRHKSHPYEGCKLAKQAGHVKIKISAGARLKPIRLRRHGEWISMSAAFRWMLSAGLLGTGFFGLAAGSASAAAVRSGVLECDVAPSVGLIVTSSKALTCVFRSDHAQPVFYTGTVSRFGLDIGVTGVGRFVWGVFSASRVQRHYALAGDYLGAGAGATLGGGLNANALVGGNANSISLQPLSINVQTGLNLSAGVGALRLEPAPPSP